MSIPDSIDKVAVSRPQILMMILCAAVGAAAAGAASAATLPDDVPRLVVRYKADSLATDSGARALYRRLVNAAEQVCPDLTGSHLISPTIEQCRAQAVARAVQQIGSPRLVELYSNSQKAISQKSSS